MHGQLRTQEAAESGMSRPCVRHWARPKATRSRLSVFSHRQPS